jgi:hypothetical protein
VKLTRQRGKKYVFIEIFFCFATFVVQNLPAHGRSLSEKNKEMTIRYESFVKQLPYTIIISYDKF